MSCRHDAKVKGHSCRHSTKVRGHSCRNITKVRGHTLGVDSKVKGLRGPLQNLYVLLLYNVRTFSVNNNLFLLKTK